jgi:hypothetical protein
MNCNKKLNMKGIDYTKLGVKEVVSASKFPQKETASLSESKVRELINNQPFVEIAHQFASDEWDGGLHFNFVSGLCLPETTDLNWMCIRYAHSQDVPTQVLTKRSDWLAHPIVQKALSHKHLIRVGFSLTGCDELEPGASPNTERIRAMKILHDAGIQTWASIEPIIDPQRSLSMMEQTVNCCDHYKIGVLSGKENYTPDQIRQFVSMVNALNPHSVYWKKSIINFINKDI